LLRKRGDQHRSGTGGSSMLPCRAATSLVVQCGAVSVSVSSVRGQGARRNQQGAAHAWTGEQKGGRRPRNLLVVWEGSWRRGVACGDRAVADAAWVAPRGGTTPQARQPQGPARKSNSEKKGATRSKSTATTAPISPRQLLSESGSCARVRPS